MKFKHVLVTKDNLSSYSKELSRLEQLFHYPFGEDSFRIDHGQDYLQFFREFGDPRLMAILFKDQVVAVAVAVFHDVFNAWYICDVKVHPEFRGNSLSRKFFYRHFIPCFFRCQRGFGLTMLSDHGPENHVTNIAKNLPLTPLKNRVYLNFFLEDYNSTFRVLENKIMTGSFISLNGKKDLIMQSTGQPLALLHFKKGVTNFDSLQKGHLHMWCLPEYDTRNADLLNLNVKPSARGVILHHGMKNMDWCLLSTSEL